MKISLEWLSDFISFTEKDPFIIAEVLTERVAEIDEVVDAGKDFAHVVSGKILEISSHPDADRVRVTQVDVGDGTPRQIICGAKNIEVGQVVPTALPGAVLSGNFSIEKRKMRGITSEGMLCSGKELGLTEDAQGILLFDEKTPIGVPVAEVLGLSDVVFKIDNTAITNRPDLFSHFGFARECVATGLATWKQKEFDFSALRQTLPKKPLPVHFRVTPPEICPARANIVLENLSDQPSPDWMQKRLRACGIRAISAIVDVSNYVMLELGMPLHIFDLDHIAGSDITMRLSQKDERVTTLDGKERVLPEGVILQEDAEKIFDLAGIMGGANSEVSETTNRVLVHVPVYDPIAIRKASLALAHRTDAATIYEKRVPSSSVLLGMMRTIQLLLDIFPKATLSSDIEHKESVPEEQRIIRFPMSLVRRMLGRDISEKEIRSILENLGFSLSMGEKDVFLAEVPGHRLGDITIPEDIAEEVVRVSGLRNIHESAPAVRTRLAKLPKERILRREVSDALVNMGFFECVTYAFLGPDLLTKSKITPQEMDVIVANPISEDMSRMRPSLLPRLLEKAMENRRHHTSFRLFEMGHIFEKESDSQKKECLQIAGVLLGEDFLAVRGVLETLSRALHIPFRFQPKEGLPFAKHVASVAVGAGTAGYAFSFSEEIKKAFDLPEHSSGFFLNAPTLLSFPQKHASYHPLPKFPSLDFDLSIVAKSYTFSEDVLRCIRNIDPLLESSAVLETFMGEGIPDGKKSVTLRVIFRAPDRTLTSAEGEALREKVLKTLEKNGYPFRF
ncbi:phenylalanine--tRNA ligase subunit beta [Candidatus Peregrinibacteria bacterium]|nr:MAG: phenylalanine--tRNA ligase subunit beta [Candidatus Peregrinibacteria bacterium]